MNNPLAKPARDAANAANAANAAYATAQQNINALLEGLTDPIAAMASVACVLKEALPQASWVGFYRVVAPGLLRVGPYQGPVGCLEIPFDRGVCGAAARTRTPQLVADVHNFPDHIACDAAARSELVMPVFDPTGVLVAVLDLDSHQPAAFDEHDQQALEPILLRLGACWGGSSHHQVVTPV